MSKHKIWGIVMAILSLTLVSVFIVSLPVESTYATLVTDDFFPFTNYAGPVAGQTYDRMMYEETDPYATVYPSSQEDYTLSAATPDLYFYTDQYPSTGSETVFESTWSVKIYVSSTAPGNKIKVSIALDGGDPTPPFDYETPQVSKSVPNAGEYTVTGFDFSTFPTGSNNLANRRLIVHFSYQTGSVTLRYGSSGYWMGLTTGTVVPEKLLGFVFFAPFIPLIAKAVARWSKREKLLATHEEERKAKR